MLRPAPAWATLRLKPLSASIALVTSTPLLTHVGRELPGDQVQDSQAAHHVPLARHQGRACAAGGSSRPSEAGLTLWGRTVKMEQSPAQPCKPR